MNSVQVILKASKKKTKRLINLEPPTILGLAIILQNCLVIVINMSKMEKCAHCSNIKTADQI